MRILLRLEFDGGSFHGWQYQPGIKTVQQSVTDALEQLCGRKIAVTGAGRTDSGVHAEDMPVHLDIDSNEYSRIENGLNSALPEAISCWSVTHVPDDFHARYSAVARSYRYRIGKGLHPIQRHSEYQPGVSVIDLKAIGKAAEYSIGEGSWRGFAKEGSGNATWDMNVYSASVEEDHRGWDFHITANRFLRGVVRIWSGTLFRIGGGRIPPEAVAEILETGNRDLAGPSLPPCGLTLTKVRYPHEL